MKTFPISDFSGGWNPRDGLNEVADNESPDMINVSLDERGGIVKRLGVAEAGSGPPVGGGGMTTVFWSEALQKLICQADYKIHWTPDPDTPWTDTGFAFSTILHCHMVDFLGSVVIVHPDDGVFTFDGITVTGPVANAPGGGISVAVWQNALWIANTQSVRVTRSDLGAISWPADPIYVDIRVKDDAHLTSIGGGTGMDVLGRTGLLVWKNESTYRINSPSTGSYTVVDYNYGASGDRAVTTNQGFTAAVCSKGIIMTTGDGGGATLVSGKIDPIFRPDQLRLPSMQDAYATNYQDRMLFSIPWLGGQAGTWVNNLTLEFDPKQGWFAPHDFGISAATPYRDGVVGSPCAFQFETNIPVSGQLYRFFTGGTDDGDPITSRHHTRWFEPNSANALRFRRLNVNGQGVFTLRFKFNYDQGVGNEYDMVLLGDDNAIWDTAVWDTADWAASTFESYDKVYSLGYGRSFAIEVVESSSLSGYGPSLLDIGPPAERGAFSVAGYYVDIQPLGNS